MWSDELKPVELMPAYGREKDLSFQNLICLPGKSLPKEPAYPSELFWGSCFS
jgi:hypothetical protein